jgi:hypothetical protein
MDVMSLSDVQLDHMLGQIGADPFNEDYDSVEALRREKRRRLAARPQAPANVEQNLQASDAPMPMEPVAGDGLRPKPTREQMDEALIYGNVLPNGQPAGPGGGIGIRNTPEDLAIYAQVVGDANRRETERMRERVAARAAARAGAAPAETATDTVMVDGVEVPAYRLSDGLPFGGMFREGDYRAARDAAREAEIVDRVSREAQEDLARYGTKQRVAYTYDDAGNITGTQNLTPITPLVSDVEQFNNLMERRAMEGRQALQNRALSSRPSLVALNNEQKQSRNFIRMRNMLAGGAQNVNSGNVGFWNRLAMMSPEMQMETVQQAMPMDRNRAEVEARQLDAAARMAGQAVTGALAGGAGEAGMERMRREQRLRDLRAAAGKAKAANPRAPRMASERALLEAGASPEERAMILGELYGAGPEPAPAPTAPPYTPPYEDSLPATSW